VRKNGEVASNTVPEQTQQRKKKFFLQSARKKLAKNICVLYFCDSDTLIDNDATRQQGGTHSNQRAKLVLDGAKKIFFAKQKKYLQTQNTFVIFAS
jgi:hypothetical protein